MNVLPMASLVATAVVVLRGFLADRSLSAALAVVIASIGLAVLLTDTSLGHGGRLEADVGWGTAELLGWFLAVTNGAGMVGRH